MPTPGRLPCREDLALPIRVIVPSRSLRLHLAESLVRHLGRAVAGVQIQTLHGAAMEILERCGEKPSTSSHLFDVIVERLAREEPGLAEPLESLIDGYLPVSGTVRDLLDAGLEEVLLEAAEDLFEADGPFRASRREVERGRALLRIAAAADRALELLGAGRAGRVLHRAQQWLEESPDLALPARAVLIYGFADATGRAMDLLEALVRHREARLFVDTPPDPAQDGVFEAAFPRILLERFGEDSIAAAVGLPREIAPPAQIERIEATDPETEILAVADRLRTLLDEGHRPESIGVVARDLGPYELVIWGRFTELGIPYSAPSARGSLTSSRRWVEALLSLLAHGEETPTDIWLETLGLSSEGDDEVSGVSGSLRMELRIAFHSVGAGRLGQAARLDPDPWIRGGTFPLPVLEGLGAELGEGDPAQASGSGSPRRGNRRALQASALRRAIDRARETLRKLEEWPREQPLESHFQALEALVGGSGQGSRGGAEQEIRRALTDLRDLSPGALQLTFREFLRLLRSGLQEVGFKPLGGRGGGVRVLSVTEARGLTFEHLFLLGLARDQFPRPIREDPLLPDSLRLLLRGLLPDIPVKRRGFEEERYLFAQLLSSSPRVVLSRPLATRDGRPYAASPLWERLRWSPRELPEIERVTSLHSEPDPGERLRDPFTHSVLAGLYGDRDQFCERFTTLVDIDEEGLEGRFAKPRLRILDEMDPDLRTPEGRRRAIELGPYFGLIGPLEGPDPRRRVLPLTVLEGMAACAWQTFLRRLLRLEPNPDPLEALPQVSPAMVGQLVHSVLEAIVDSSAPGGARSSLQEALASVPAQVEWPEAQRFEVLLKDRAESLLRAQGVAFLRLAEPLALRARPYLGVAQESLFAEGGILRASGSEVEGSVQVGAPLQSQPVSFRADLVCEVEGEWRILDFKTGRPLSRNKTPKGRRADLLRAVARGERLQAVAYLVAAREALSDEAGATAQGGYLFLDPATDSGSREASVGPGDADLEEAFAEAAAVTLTAWREGAFPPRVVDEKTDKEPRRCQFCTVAQACVRGDSGARRRLLRISEHFPDPAADPAADPDPRSPLERAFQNIWQLGNAP